MSKSIEQGATESAWDGELAVDEIVERVIDVFDNKVTQRVRRMNIVERMARVMAEMQVVDKSGQNREQGYKFRPIDEFMNSLHGPLSKYGVVITPRVKSIERSERDRMRQGTIVGITRVVDMLVEYTFSAPDGSEVVTVTAGEGADVADKATNKAMAGALKYAIMQTFMVPTRDMVDADQTTPDVPSGSANAQQQRASDAQLNVPPRHEIMSKLDEACEALGKTRAALTEKWRKTHDVGVVKNLDDPDKVPDLELYRYVVSLQPYVAQAKRQQQAGEPDEAKTDEQLAAEQQIGDAASQEPSDAERAAQPNVNTVLCDATNGDKKCTGAAGHSGDHVWW